MQTTAKSAIMQHLAQPSKAVRTGAAREALPDPADQMRDRLRTFTPLKMVYMPNLVNRVRRVFQSKKTLTAFRLIFIFITRDERFNFCF